MRLRIYISHLSVPVIRMADLYLMYAEALNEKGEDYATVLPWIDMVRERSGLKGVKESWDQYVGNSKYATQTGLRQIIMQERRIELAFEGHYFGMSVGGKLRQQN